MCRRRAALLAAALAACVRVADGRSAAARASASGSGGGASNSGIIPLTSTAAAAPLPPELQAAAAAAFEDAAATLSGTPLTCGDVNALQSGYSRTSDLGDGFFRVVPSAAASIAAVQAAAPGTAVTVPSSDLDGANVFLTNYLAQKAGVNVTYQIGRVPATVAVQGPLGVLQYAFATWGWDCVLSGVVLTPDKQVALNFFMPTQRYSLAVVAVREVKVIGPKEAPLGAWALPFESTIWAMLAALIIVSGSLMYHFEHDSANHDDLGPQYIHWSDRLGRAVYKACSNWTAVGSFAPHTPAGRLYSMTFAFVMLLMQSAYTANLAAFFTHTPPPVPRVAGLEAFAPAGMSACVSARDPVHAGWLGAHFPGTSQSTVAGSAVDVLLQVEARSCTGGLAPDVELNFALSAAGDPTGAFCDLDIIQNGHGANVFAIPVRNDGPWAAADALNAANKVLAVALAYGDYAAEAAVQFGGNRPICVNQASIRDALASNRAAIAPLGTEQLAGIFFLAGCGLFLAGGVYAVGHVASLQRAWDAVRGITHDEDAGGAESEGEGTKEEGTAVGAVQLRKQHKLIPLSAMLNIERSLEVALQQFNHIAQTQRELDVGARLDAARGVASAATSSTPLAVVAKIERALAFGLKAEGELVLFDSETGEELSTLGFRLPSSEALATAHSHMAAPEAAAMEAVLAAFLKSSIAARRRAARRQQLRR